MAAKPINTRNLRCAMFCIVASAAGAQSPAAPAPAPITISAAQCTAARAGDSIPVTAIGEPVSGVRISAPVWNEEAAGVPANCQVDGEMLPVSKGPHAQSIHFRVLFPALWQGIAVQFGGGGMNGILPRLSGVPGGSTTVALADGAATYGSDSGHTVADPAWALDDEAVKNLSYMQMKKTHDAAMVLIRRIYGQAPRFNYYAGNSQGGREALTVAQRYPQDYDGITASVPIVNFSGLMIGPVHMRIQEKPLAAWVSPVKGRAIAAEFMRQCDGLDGLEDGVINNYQACRAIFNLTTNGGKHPWAAKQCPGDVDPNPTDSSAAACLTGAQIRTLEFDFSSYKFPQPYANGVAAYGMWAPTTAVAGGGMGGPPPGANGASPDPGRPGARPGGGPAAPMDGGSIITSIRWRGQQGAAPDAPMLTHLGILGSIGFVMQDLNANPLDYVEGGPYLARRLQVSEWMDATNPDLGAFRKHGGKLLITVGTDDTVASSGSQLDYYQAVLNKMGRPAVDSFMRMWVIPQANHGLQARSYVVNGKGETLQVREMPTTYDRLAALREWVEKGVVPPKAPTLTGRTGTMPLCSFPDYPRYTAGDPTQSASYSCTAP